MGIHLPVAQKIQIDEIYLMDCRDGMRLMADATVDLIITDPPFAIEFQAKRSNYNRNVDRVLEGYAEVPREQYVGTRQTMTQSAFSFNHRFILDARTATASPRRLTMSSYSPDSG